MEYKMVTIPFDLETAKKINIGERVGQIVTEKGRNRAEIVYEDNSSICPLLVVIHSISVSADWFSATGKAFSSENRLLLEVPEYTTFKDGDVLSNKDGSYIFILNMHGKYNGETKVEYGRLNTEKGTYAHWLNYVTCISYNRHKPVMEVECNECTSKLFVDMIKSICKISEQVKSFINPEQIKAIAESNEPILLLSNN